MKPFHKVSYGGYPLHRSKNKLDFRFHDPSWPAEILTLGKIGQPFDKVAFYTVQGEFLGGTTGFGLTWDDVGEFYSEQLLQNDDPERSKHFRRAFVAVANPKEDPRE